MGNALLDYQKGRYTEDILTYSSLEEEDRIPLPYLFRDFDRMPALEQKALELCQGSVLDIGCGAGSHSLYLQQKGHDVVALDSSPGAIEVCRQRDIKKVVVADIHHYRDQKFDTLLMLMNGIGIVGKLNKLGAFLAHLRSLLRPNGQILLDSSDIIYMFDEDWWIAEDGPYYGEVEFTMMYKGKKSDPFSWLYLDYRSLQDAAEANNFSCELVSHGDHFDYLARLRALK